MSTPPRHILPLTIALIFSLIIIFDWKIFFGKLLLILAVILFIIVSYKNITLYWQPSSEKILNNLLIQKFNSTDNAFIIDGGTGRLSLPLNSQSLTLLSSQKKEMGRNKILLQNLDRVDSLVKFKPLVAMEDTSNSINHYIDIFKKQNKKIWIISNNCNNPCSAKELQENSCFSINNRACSIKSTLPQESTILSDFLNSDILGAPFVVRKVN